MGNRIHCLPLNLVSQRPRRLRFDLDRRKIGAGLYAAVGKGAYVGRRFRMGNGVHRLAADMFTPQPGQARPGIPTGLGSDLQANLQRRNSART